MQKKYVFQISQLIHLSPCEGFFQAVAQLRKLAQVCFVCLCANITYWLEHGPLDKSITKLCRTVILEPSLTHLVLCRDELAKNINADEAAAMGAVYQAAALSKAFKVKPFLVRDAAVFPIQVNKHCLRSGVNLCLMAL